MAEYRFNTSEFKEKATCRNSLIQLPQQEPSLLSKYNILRWIMFDTKIAILVRDDLATWQKLNVTAFLMSGITGANSGLIGKNYVDFEGNTYLPMSRQPVIVLTGSANVLRNARKRANERGVKTVAYIEQMFSTGHDEENRKVFSEHASAEENTVGLALRADKKVVDKITKGAKMHL